MSGSSIGSSRTPRRRGISPAPRRGSPATRTGRRSARAATPPPSGPPRGREPAGSMRMPEPSRNGRGSTSPRSALPLGANEQGLGNRMSKAGGQLPETFVADEIARQVSWSEGAPLLYHYRDKAREVDLILETPDGRVAAIEVKSGASVSDADFRALAYLRDRIGPDFVQG